MCGVVRRISASIAPEWSSKASYVANDIVMYDGVRYIAKESVQAGKKFNPAQWTARSIQEDLNGGGGGGGVSMVVLTLDESDPDNIKIMKEATVISEYDDLERLVLTGATVLYGRFADMPVRMALYNANICDDESVVYEAIGSIDGVIHSRTISITKKEDGNVVVAIGELIRMARHDEVGAGYMVDIGDGEFEYVGALKTAENEKYGTEA